jgi:hypothetical protein
LTVEGPIELGGVKKAGKTVFPAAFSAEANFPGN